MPLPVPGPGPGSGQPASATGSLSEAAGVGRLTSTSRPFRRSLEVAIRTQVCQALNPLYFWMSVQLSRTRILPHLSQLLTKPTVYHCACHRPTSTEAQPGLEDRLPVPVAGTCSEPNRMFRTCTMYFSTTTRALILLILLVLLTVVDSEIVTHWHSLAVTGDFLSGVRSWHLKRADGCQQQLQSRAESPAPCTQLPACQVPA